MKLSKFKDNEVLNILKKLRKELRSRGLSYFDIDFKQVNDWIMCQCPYHSNGEEKHPSSGFNIESGRFHCFSCNKSASLQEVIEYCFNKNKGFGKYWLNNYSEPKKNNNRKVELSFNNNQKTNSDNTTYIDKNILNDYKFIHSYLINDRHLDPNILIKFDVGYDKNKDCITFPIKDQNGNIVLIATRNIKNKFFHYTKSSCKPVYGLYEILKAKEEGQHITEIYITESIIDCLTIWGFNKYAVALNGLGSVQQYKELSNFDCRTYILATDNDTAGKEARKKISNNLKNKIVKEIDYKSYNNKKDINEFTKDEFLNSNIIFYHEK